jgi:acyl-ACP thioesterase
MSRPEFEPSTSRTEVTSVIARKSRSIKSVFCLRKCDMQTRRRDLSIMRSFYVLCVRQWYSTFFVRVPPDIIYLQLCTPKVVGV